ncbi:aminotransferase class V-fold PLP-dependent enzyme [Rubrivirga sp. S365]|uniref:Aminotransferase class V-fold PLP-dependent enzyme n=1 Tax=Rubrivirga litoralis TaxID=3075598 RepID=A0ABU3BUV3_9BACT|nr:MULTISPECIES: aminotransferase class V-fold PLP-dependent enzyme [unclassified Rubrivirga]MDT0633052.1 aminotransferase class V-fold PLP-dependent enzyme [Rubrivirga sp. F394]MDT7857119.1 aminotransferase class V-fold PLP-dependent enzyme [Rubrivirga sp. S365]
MTLDAYRDLFDLPADVAYLDHAATGVLSRPAREAAVAFLDARAGRDPSRSPNDYPTDLERVDRARRRAAALVGAGVRNVEVVPNTSAGLGLLASGLDWRPGDRVVVPACEFPANVLPWRALEDRGVAVDLVPHREGTFTVEDVEAVLRPETRLVAVSWVQFLSGFRCDLDGLGALCRERGVLFAVDAIQGVGALRLDVGAVRPDLVAFGGHKWLCGMQGAGVVVVADTLLDRLRPARGWLNGPIDWDDLEAAGLALHDDATRFRTGTLPTAQLYALDAALGLFLDVGADAVEAAVLAGAGRLADGLARLGARRYGTDHPARASGIVTVAVADPEGLHAHLAERGVAVSLRNRLVRFAPHAHTREADLDRALDAVASFGRVAAGAS